MIILSYIIWFIVATAGPLQRRWLAKTKNASNEGQIHFSFMVSLVAALLSLLFPLFQPFFISGNIYYLIALSLICGISGVGFYISLYTAQKYVEAGVTSVISNIYTPITIVLATFFLNEKLSFLQIIGTALLLFGIIIVSKKHRTGKFTFDKYFLLMIFSGVMLAFLLVASRALVNVTGLAAGTMLSWWSTCIFLGIATLITRNKGVFSKKDILITGVLSCIQNLSFAILVYVVGNLSLVSSVTTFKVVIMFLAGAVLLKERDNLPRKIIGSLIAVAGLLLMK